MNLTAEQLLENWEQLLGNIKKYIAEPRQQTLLAFYEENAERIITMPASGTTKYHNCFPGGYVEHINRVVDCAIGQYKLWDVMGCDMTTFTLEELVFAAINHDLGKIGDSSSDLYIPSQDEWRKKNLGELYSYNNSIPFMTIPDRSLFLLQEAGIKYTLNEMLAIRTHDGLYDEANRGYLISRIPESRPKSAIVYILHQADLMASIIETQRGVDSLPKSKNFTSTAKVAPSPTATPTAITYQQKAKNKALSNVKSEGLKNVMDNFFNS